MQVTPYKEIEKIKYCSKCHKVKSVHKTDHCVCPKKIEGLKGSCK